MKKLLAVLFAFGLVSVSQASELWWTVSGEPDGVEWTEAKLFANQTGYNYGGTEVGSVSKADLSKFGDAYTELGSHGDSSYSFYVELFNGDTTTGQKTYVSTTYPVQGAVKYDELSGSIAPDEMRRMGTSVYTGFSQFTTSDVIPEPTSGLLMALGMMMLALKRRRV